MRPLVFALLLLLPGCLAYKEVKAKYFAQPPTSSASAATTPAAGPQSPYYIAPSELDLTQLLPPPPAAGSPAQKQDIDAVLAAQKMRSPALAKQVEDDAKISLFVFASVLGPNFSEANLPVTVAFFQKVRKNVSALGDITKTCYERPRPFVVDKHVHPPDELADETKSDPTRDEAARPLVPTGPGSACPAAEPLPAYSYSYPSGHSTFGAMAAILLGDMVPEKRRELFARGWYFGQERVIAGVHFPTDVEAGRIQASIIIAMMMQDPQFKTDFAAARAETRKALGLAD